MKASEIAKYLNGSLVGEDIDVIGVCTLNNPKQFHMAFYNGRSPLIMPFDVLVISNYNVSVDATCCIQTGNPRLAFTRAMTAYFVRREDGYKQPIIGKDCYIHPTAVINVPGFAFERDENGVPIYRPHIGRLIIGDNVRVGALTVIQRGTIDDTIIGNNVKIDDQCHIGHNNIIGDNTIIASGACICGTVTIGKNCWIGAGAKIMQHITIGDNVTIGLGANVVKSVPDGETYAGFMARPLNELLVNRGYYEADACL